MTPPTTQEFLAQILRNQAMLMGLATPYCGERQWMELVESQRSTQALLVRHAEMIAEVPGRPTAYQADEAAKERGECAKVPRVMAAMLGAKLADRTYSLQDVMRLLREAADKIDDRGVR